MRLSDSGSNKRCAASKEEIPHLGTFRGERSTIRQRVNDISESEREISEAEQALATDSLGYEYCDPCSEGRSNTR